MPQLELARLDLPPRHLSTLRELLARHVPDAEVWAYGSRISGTGHEGSDLDLVLRYAPEQHSDVAGWCELRQALQDSHLPMLVEVHLWSRLPPAFQHEIERAYAVLQAGRRGE